MVSDTGHGHTINQGYRYHDKEDHSSSHEREKQKKNLEEGLYSGRIPDKVPEKNSEFDTEAGSTKGTGNIENKTRDQASVTAQNLLKNGEVSMSNLESMIPSNIPNSFKSTDTITDGAKYEFILAMDKRL